MKVSTKGRYALRMMLDLALQGDEVVRIKDISLRQEISEKYLEQIVSVLKKAGYVNSVRGAQGEYCLAGKPQEYTVGMILRLTEGSMAPVACVDTRMDGRGNTCSRAPGCTALKLWTMVDDAVNGVIDKVTLADMVQWEREKENET